MGQKAHNLVRVFRRFLRLWRGSRGLGLRGRDGLIFAFTHLVVFRALIQISAHLCGVSCLLALVRVV
jgi:hypothetical protein